MPDAQDYKDHKTMYKVGKDPYNPESGGIPDIGDMAEQHISKWVHGNGLPGSAVKVRDKHQDLLVFDVDIEFEFQPAVQEQREHGKSSKGEECVNKLDMQKKITEYQSQNLKTKEKVTLLAGKIQLSKNAGWGLKQKIPLPEIGKEFIYHEKCKKCQGKKQSPCAKCKGKGQIACFNCKGFGLMECYNCNGAGVMNMPDGTQKECSKCHGKCKAKCIECQGKKYMICDGCRGAKYQGCTGCSKTGWITVRNFVSFDAMVTTGLTDYHTQNFPAAVYSLWESAGEIPLAEDGHFKVSFLAPDEYVVPENRPAEEKRHLMPGQPDPEEERIRSEAGQEGEEPEPRLHYQVEVPYGHAEFSVGEARYTTQIAGCQAWIVEINDFLDPLVKPGIAALQKIVKGPMAQGSLLEKALKIRMIKETFSARGRASKGKLLKMIKKKYPRGLSDKYAKACIHYVDLVMGSLTEKPRMIGMGVGIATSAAVFGGWFFAGLRGMAIASLPAQQHTHVDFALAGGMGVLAYFMVRLFASSALKKIMSYQSDAGNMKQPLPPAGNPGIYAFLGTLLAFGALAFAAPEQPAWLGQLGL